MRDASGEESELLERFRLATFCVGALPRSNIAENQDDAGDFVFAVANRRGYLFDHALISVARSQGDVFGEIEQNRLRLGAITAFLRFGLRGKIDRHVKDGFERLADSFF